MESGRPMGKTSGHWKGGGLDWDRLGLVGSLRGIRGRDGVAVLLCYASNRKVLGGDDDGDGENGGGKVGMWKGESCEGLTEKGSGRVNELVH